MHKSKGIVKAGAEYASARRTEMPARLRRVALADISDLLISSNGCLVLLRHAQSQWNLEHRFTGWTDVGLTPLGQAEAAQAAGELLAAGLRFDEAHASRLTRAQETLRIVLDTMRQPGVPAYVSWRLNERHYGALQGLDKRETAERYGEAQVLRWRRGYADRPPPLEASDLRHPRHDPRYADLAPSSLPATESLADVLARLRPYWENRLLPSLQAGRRLLITSHGNTLRALIMYLEGLGVDEVEALEIPTATPVVYSAESADEDSRLKGAA